MDNEDIKDNLREIKDNLNEIREEGMRRAKDQYRNINEKIMNEKERIKYYARNNPEKAIMISLGAGFLAGVIVTLIAMSKKR